MKKIAHIVASCEAEAQAIALDPLVQAYDTVTHQIGMKDLRKVVEGAVIVSAMSIPAPLLTGRSFVSFGLNLPYGDTEAVKEARDYLLTEGSVEEWQEVLGSTYKLKIIRDTFDLGEKRREKQIQAYRDCETPEEMEALLRAVLGLPEADEVIEEKEEA